MQNVVLVICYLRRKLV